MKSHQADMPCPSTGRVLMTTIRGLKQWVLLLAWACVLLHLSPRPSSAHASLVFPKFRFNKTHLDKVNKLVWMNRFRKALEVAEGQSSRAANEIEDDSVKKAHVTHAPPVMMTPSVSESAGRRPRAQFSHPPPLIVFSKSSGKNLVEFSIKQPSSSDLSVSVSKINLYVYVWKRREARRQRRNRRRFRGKRLIKIRIFQVDERNRKGKRIAELRKNVHSSHWHRLSLPVSVVHSTLKAQNGTLRLRVRCKRCTRKVHLILPSDAVKCSRHRIRRQKLKANLLRASPSPSSSSPSSSSGTIKNQLKTLDADKKCSLVGVGVPGLLPFMVIENKLGGFSNNRSRRSKRDAGRGPSDSHSLLRGLSDVSDGLSISPQSISFPGGSSRASSSVPSLVEKTPNMLTKDSHRLQQLPRRTSVSSASLSTLPRKSLEASEDLNSLQFTAKTKIISSLLTVVSQILNQTQVSWNRPKRSTTTTSASSSSSSSLPPPTLVCNPSPRHSDCCVLAVPVDPAEYGMGESIVAPTTLMATSCEGACPAARRRRRMRGSGRRGGRRKKGRQWSCQPVEQNPLEIWYFDHNHELAHASLPGLVISQCACRRQ